MFCYVYHTFKGCLVTLGNSWERRRAVGPELLAPRSRGLWGVAPERAPAHVLGGESAQPPLPGQALVLRAFWKLLHPSHQQAVLGVRKETGLFRTDSSVHAKKSLAFLVITPHEKVSEATIPQCPAAGEWPERAVGSPPCSTGRLWLHVACCQVWACACAEAASTRVPPVRVHDVRVWRDPPLGREQNHTQL